MVQISVYEFIIHRPVTQVHVVEFIQEFLPRSAIQSQQAQYVPSEILFYLRVLDLQPLFWRISYRAVTTPCSASAPASPASTATKIATFNVMYRILTLLPDPVKRLRGRGQELSMPIAVSPVRARSRRILQQAQECQGLRSTMFCSLVQASFYTTSYAFDEASRIPLASFSIRFERY